MWYDLLVQPLVTIFQYLYLAVVKLTGNLGVSLILLSVVVNVILRPFLAWTSRIQDKERRLQEILAPQIAELKAQFHGAEQHARISELYHRYAYNPIYAIRSGMNLFIQLPLLTAAYIMLSSLDIMKGQSFWCIADLSQPDGLLWGVNLLPLLMTAINFLATLTTPQFSRRERGQAFFIAILFLVLLYNAPSALLVYWTTNNLIMLLKNFSGVLGRVFRGNELARLWNREVVPSAGWILGVRILTFAVAFGLLAVYAFYVRAEVAGENVNIITKNGVLFYNIYIFLFLFIFAFVWMLYTRFLEQGCLVSEWIIKTVCLLAGAVCSLFYLKFTLIPAIQALIPTGKTIRSSALQSAIFFVLQGLFLAFGFLLPVPEKKLSSLVDRMAGGREKTLFFASLFSILSFLCVFSPSILYKSDPSFLPNSLPVTIVQMASYGILSLWFFIFLWSLLPRLLQKIFSWIMAFFVCVFFINAFILTANYGSFDKVAFATVIPSSLTKISLAKDCCSVLLTLTIFSFLAWKKRIVRLVQAFAILSIAFIGTGFYCWFSTEPDGGEVDFQAQETFPAYHERLWSLSRNEKNVIGIFLDMFTGDHIQRILSEEPELVNKLEGFVYFPDTIATGNGTFLSSPSIYGGPSYKPAILNQMFPEKSLEEKFAEAYAILPNIFSEKGYNVVMAGYPYLKKDNPYFLTHITKESNILYGDDWGKDYIPHWLQWAKENHIEILKNKDSISPFIFMLSLFRGIPFCLRPIVYNKGQWLGNDISAPVLEAAFQDHFLPNISTIQFMGDFITVNSNEKPTFKMIYNVLPHLPWYLEAETLQPVVDPYPETKAPLDLVDGVIPEHYFTEKHVVHFISDFIASLKENGIYDNTRIVIFSDHDEFDSWRLTRIFDEYSYPGRPNALLMFKDFGEHGPLRTSEALMSCEDIPTLLLEGIAQVEGIPDMEELKALSAEDRIRTHFSPYAWSQPFSDKLFKLKELYEVKGTMFKKENWTKIQ